MEQFFELLQISIGTRKAFSVMPSTVEWESLLQESILHGLVGITYEGVTKLVEEPDCSIPRKVLLNWSCSAIQLKDQNRHVSAQCEKLLRHFREAGFQAIILKGQSNLPNYPEHLRTQRMPGDIDIWVKGKSKNEVYQYIRKFFPDEKYRYLHVGFPVYSDTVVEVHLRPAYLCNPISNLRFQRWVDAIDLEGLEDLSKLREFNAVYQPLHIFKHLLRDGITFRQLLDYYFLLRQEPYQDKDILSKISLSSFCEDLRAVVMHLFEAAPLPSDSSKRLLEEIMVHGISGKTPLKGHWNRIFHFSRTYTNEILWRPYYKVFHIILEIWHKLPFAS